MREIVLIAAMLMSQVDMGGPVAKAPPKPAPMTAEQRQSAMKNVLVTATIQQHQIDGYAATEKFYHDLGISQKTVKERMVTDSKKRLGLDNTWVWDDKQGWVKK